LLNVGGETSWETAAWNTKIEFQDNFEVDSGHVEVVSTGSAVNPMEVSCVSLLEIRVLEQGNLQKSAFSHGGIFA
jgi:hypothetical protein